MHDDTDYYQLRAKIKARRDQEHRNYLLARMVVAGVMLIACAACIRYVRHHSKPSCIPSHGDTSTVRYHGRQVLNNL